eukprot:2304575-Rhodomonas_salina.1
MGACANPGLCECNSQVRICNHNLKRKKEESKQKERGERGESAHLSAKGLMGAYAVLEKRRSQCCLPFGGSSFWQNRR